MCSRVKIPLIGVLVTLILTSVFAATAGATTPNQGVEVASVSAQHDSHDSSDENKTSREDNEADSSTSPTSPTTSPSSTSEESNLDEETAEPTSPTTTPTTTDTEDAEDDSTDEDDTDAPAPKPVQSPADCPHGLMVGSIVHPNVCVNSGVEPSSYPFATGEVVTVTAVASIPFVGVFTYDVKDDPTNQTRLSWGHVVTYVWGPFTCQVDGLTAEPPTNIVFGDLTAKGILAQLNGYAAAGNLGCPDMPPPPPPVEEKLVVCRVVDGKVTKDLEIKKSEFNEATDSVDQTVAMCNPTPPPPVDKDMVVCRNVNGVITKDLTIKESQFNQVTDRTDQSDALCNPVPPVVMAQPAACTALEMLYTPVRPESLIDRDAKLTGKVVFANAANPRIGVYIDGIFSHYVPVGPDGKFSFDGLYSTSTKQVKYVAEVQDTTSGKYVTSDNCWDLESRTLPVTGAAYIIPMTIGAILVLLIGLVLVISTRRRRGGDSDSSGEGFGPIGSDLEPASGVRWTPSFTPFGTALGTLRSNFSRKVEDANEFVGTVYVFVVKSLLRFARAIVPSGVTFFVRSSRAMVTYPVVDPTGRILFLPVPLWTRLERLRLA